MSTCQCFVQRLTGLSKRTRRIAKPNPVSRPIVPRTLLPKAPSSSDQVIQVSVIADKAKSGVIVSSASSASSSLTMSFLSSASCRDSTPTKPTVITMAPTEFRKRRIVPTPVPVAVPCGMWKVAFDQNDLLTCPHPSWWYCPIPATFPFALASSSATLSLHTQYTCVCYQYLCCPYRMSENNKKLISNWYCCRLNYFKIHNYT